MKILGGCFEGAFSFSGALSKVKYSAIIFGIETANTMRHFRCALT
jgi:hypothetical protein